MNTTIADSIRPGVALIAAPHRTLFFTGLLALVAASAAWGLHLVARYTGAPLFAFDLAIAPIWAHAFLMLFAVFPTVFFGFLFTVFPRWMNGPLVRRGEYVMTAALLGAGTLVSLVGMFGAPATVLLGCLLVLAGLLLGIGALIRVLLAVPQIVSHAVVTLVALCVQAVALAGFTYGVWQGNDFALHFAVRTSLWGGLLPAFVAVCHRMIPFFSQGAVPGYVPWRPTWILTSIVVLVYARILLGTLGVFAGLPIVDAALLVLTAWCAVRWTAPQARGNPLLWSLYAGFAWLPVALLLQLVRDGAFVMTGEWMLGRAPIHALGMGFFGSLLVAMVTRVTMGHSGRPLRIDHVTLGCFLVLQIATVSRIASEIVAAPRAIQCLLLGGLLLWVGAVTTWVGRVARIYLQPRIDGRPG